MHRENVHLVLFDMAVGGHHGTYIWHLVKHWNDTTVAATLTIIVAPSFPKQHEEVVDLVRQNSSKLINLLVVSDDEFAQINAQRSVVKRAFAEWRVLCHYAHELRADQALVMQFDHLQIPLVFGERAPCPIAGIYFRPTFHYVQFPHYRSTRKDALRRWRQKLLLALALQSGQVNTLFSLDPFAPQSIAPLAPRVKVAHLPDPILPHPSDPLGSNELRNCLKIEPHRRVFLLFGKLDSRKGTHQLLEAIRQLPPHLSQKLCLLLVGQVPVSESQKLNSLVSKLLTQSGVQIVIYDEFVPEAQIPLYFQMAHIVLAPYQRHVGMSGILLHAAASRKPVIASNYGLMGELIRRYELGLAVDTEQPAAIAQAMTQVFSSSAASLANASKMQAFIEQNLAEKYACTLVSHLI